MEDTKKKFNTQISEMSSFIIAETHQFLLNIFPRGTKLQVNSIRLHKMLHDFPRGTKLQVNSIPILSALHNILNCLHWMRQRNPSSSSLMGRVAINLSTFGVDCVNRFWFTF